MPAASLTSGTASTATSICRSSLRSPSVARPNTAPTATTTSAATPSSVRLIQVFMRLPFMVLFSAADGLADAGSAGQLGPAGRVEVRTQHRHEAEQRLRRELGLHACDHRRALG